MQCMHACMYACMHACMYGYMDAWMHDTHTHTHTHTRYIAVHRGVRWSNCTQKRFLMHESVSLYVSLHVSLYVSCASPCMCPCMCLCMKTNRSSCTCSRPNPPTGHEFSKVLSLAITGSTRSRALTSENFCQGPRFGKYKDAHTLTPPPNSDSACPRGNPQWLHEDEVLWNIDCVLCRMCSL